MWSWSSTTHAAQKPHQVVALTHIYVLQSKKKLFSFFHTARCHKKLLTSILICHKIILTGYQDTRWQWLLQWGAVYWKLPSQCLLLHQSSKCIAIFGTFLAFFSHIFGISLYVPKIVTWKSSNRPKSLEYEMQLLLWWWIKLEHKEEKIQSKIPR